MSEVGREERRDDEAREEWDDRLMTANLKRDFDIFGGDDRTTARILFQEYLVDRAQARRQAEEAFAARTRQQEELHQQTMRHAEELFTTRSRDQLQSTAHRDLAIASQWRDQGRDSGESVFAPKQSS